MAVALKEQRSVGGSEAVAVRPDGSRIPFIAYPTLLHDDNGEMVGAVNLLVDATDRHLAESYQQWLAAIVESSDDAIVGKDLHGIVTSWNKGAERLFGYTAQEMVGQSITRLMAPDKQDEELHILDRIGRGERVDHFETVRFRKDGNPVHISLTISPVRDRHGRIVGASKIARDITERRLAEQRQVMLVNEIKHRIKNTLATVQAIASQTLRSLNESEREAFFDRLRALSVAHDLVTTESWEVARLWDLVERVLQPFRECRDQQFMIRGPRDVALDASKSSLLCMILHELATNAIKSGSLSVDCGRVELAWEMVGDGGGRRLRLRWQETGGPPVKPPKRKGFGLLLLERAVDPQQGSACLRFDPSGFVCVLELVV